MNTLQYDYHDNRVNDQIDKVYGGTMLVYQNKNYKIYQRFNVYYVIDPNNCYVWESKTLMSCIEYIDIR